MHPLSMTFFNAGTSNKLCRNCGKRILCSEVRISVPRNGETSYFQKIATKDDVDQHIIWCTSVKRANKTRKVE